MNGFFSPELQQLPPPASLHISAEPIANQGCDCCCGMLLPSPDLSGIETIQACTLMYLACDWLVHPEKIRPSLTIHVNLKTCFTLDAAERLMLKYIELILMMRKTIQATAVQGLSGFMSSWRPVTPSSSMQIAQQTVLLSEPSNIAQSALQTKLLSGMGTHGPGWPMELQSKQTSCLTRWSNEKEPGCSSWHTGARRWQSVFLEESVILIAGHLNQATSFPFGLSCLATEYQFSFRVSYQSAELTWPAR